MKKFICILISLILALSLCVLSVSAADYEYTPKQIFGNVHEAFVIGSDGSISQQYVYAVGDYGYGMLPSSYPLKEFEMQFSFQIDTDVTTNDYIIFNMAFDKLTYNYQFSFITYELYVAGGGTLLEQSFTFQQKNETFSFEGYSLYNGVMSIDITFNYADVGVSEEEYFFSSVQYFKGAKENAPVYEEIDIGDKSGLDEKTGALEELNQSNLDEAISLFSDPASTLYAFNDGFNCIKIIFLDLFDGVPWVSYMLYLCLIVGLFAALFDMGGVVSRWLGSLKTKDK